MTKLLTASELTTEEQLQICQKSRDDYSELCRTMEIANEKLVDELREALEAEKDKVQNLEQRVFELETAKKPHILSQIFEHAIEIDGESIDIRDDKNWAVGKPPQDNEMKEGK